MIIIGACIGIAQTLCKYFKPNNRKELIMPAKKLVKSAKKPVVKKAVKPAKKAKK